MKFFLSTVKKKHIRSADAFYEFGRGNSISIGDYLTYKILLLTLNLDLPYIVIPYR